MNNIDISPIHMDYTVQVNLWSAELYNTTSTYAVWSDSLVLPLHAKKM